MFLLVHLHSQVIYYRGIGVLGTCVVFRSLVLSSHLLCPKIGRRKTDLHGRVALDGSRPAEFITLLQYTLPKSSETKTKVAGAWPLTVKLINNKFAVAGTRHS